MEKLILDGRGFLSTSLLGLSASKSLSLNIVQLCIAALIIINYKKLLSWGLSNAGIHGYTNMTLGVILHLLHS